MRRKSERTVKSSPAKKAEPTSRRTSRRTRKSPEKTTTITEEDSENSSDQAASSSENEADDVSAAAAAAAAAPPKRARRSSRTIEKSSSTEEIVVKATTSRSRRRTTVKKDDDIREEEEEEEEDRGKQEENNAITAEAEQTTLDEPKQSGGDEREENEEPSAPEPPTTAAENVDSSTELTGAGDEVHQECDNSIQPDGNDEHQVTTAAAAAAAAEAVAVAVAETVPATEIKIVDVEMVEQSTEIGSAHETKQSNAEPIIEQSTKSRRRTLKRIDKENIVDVKVQTKAKIGTDDKKSSTTIEEVESSESKAASAAVAEDNSVNESQPLSVSVDNAELQNGRNIQSDAADTTAKDTTTASETDSTTKVISKKKPIIRKRKWLTNKMAAPKVQEIAISTDSLKGLISDVKPVPLSDVQLDSSPEADQESDDVKVVSSTSIDYNRRSEEHVFEVSDDAVASGGGTGGGGGGGATINISTSRKVSIVNESEGEQPLSPAKHTPCNILYITNLVRPFTVLQLKSLLQRTGKIVEDGFWIDKIKSKCFVKYETEDEAIETRHALHGIRWPTSNPKCLNVDFGTENLMEKAMASTAEDIKPSAPLSRDDRIVSSNNLHESTRERGAAAVDRPIREWDLGKKETHKPREFDRSERDREREQKTARDSGRDRDRDRDRDRERERAKRESERELEREPRRRRSTSGSPSRKYAKKDNEPPLRLLDDLFRKTKTTPCVYWLPLTPEQIAVRIEERKKAIENRKRERERREAIRKEMEREEAERKRERENRDRERDRERRSRERRSENKRERSSRDRDERRDRDRRDGGGGGGGGGGGNDKRRRY